MGIRVRWRVLLFVAMIVVASVQFTSRTSATPQQTSAPQALTAEEQTRKAIYAAVLHELLNAERQWLVISTTEAPRAAAIQRFRSAPGGKSAPPPILSLALKSPFTSGDRIDARLLPDGTRFVEQEEIRAFFAEWGAREAWARFRDVWGADGYVSLSSVSMTPDSRAALVYVASACGGLCGVSKYVWVVRGRSLADWSVGGTVVIAVS